MNANTKGIIFVKADRINERIDKLASIEMNRMKELEQEDVPKQEFFEFVKGIHIIVDTELNEKGVERKWKKSSQKQESLNNACLQGTMKEPMSWLKTLMMKLHL